MHETTYELMLTFQFPFFFFFKVHGHPLVLFIFIQSGYLLLCCTMNSTVDKKHCGSQSAKFHRRNHVSYTAYTQANHTSVMQPSNPLHSVPAVLPATSRCLSFTVHGPHPVSRPLPAPSPPSKTPSPHNIYTIIWKWQLFENSPWLSDIKSDLSSAECLAGEMAADSRTMRRARH